MKRAFFLSVLILLLFISIGNTIRGEEYDLHRNHEEYTSILDHIDISIVLCSALVKLNDSGIKEIYYEYKKEFADSAMSFEEFSRALTDYKEFINLYSERPDPYGPKGGQLYVDLINTVEEIKSLQDDINQAVMIKTNDLQFIGGTIVYLSAEICVKAIDNFSNIYSDWLNYYYEDPCNSLKYNYESLKYELIRIKAIIINTDIHYLVVVGEKLRELLDRTLAIMEKSIPEHCEDKYWVYKLLLKKNRK